MFRIATHRPESTPVMEDTVTREVDVVHEVLIGLGANLGDRLDTLQRAFAKIRQLPGSEAESWVSSAVYQTRPVSEIAQGDYLNAVVRGRTHLAPSELLAGLLQIERELGRDRTREQTLGQNAPRVIDLDLLDYGGLRIAVPALEVPHPAMHERWFVLRPLVDVAPNWVHPISRKPAKDLLATQDDTGVGERFAPPLTGT